MEGDDNRSVLEPDGPGTAPGTPLPTIGGAENILIRIRTTTIQLGVSRVELRHRSQGDDVQPAIYRFVYVDVGELDIRDAERPVTLYPEHVNRFRFDERTRILSIWTN